MANTEILIRLIIAASLGSLIGFERERLLWAADIRTHMLALQLPFIDFSESMGNHDWKIVGADSVD
jgi:hypothetical protein